MIELDAQVRTVGDVIGSAKLFIDRMQRCEVGRNNDCIRRGGSDVNGLKAVEVMPIRCRPMVNESAGAGS